MANIILDTDSYKHSHYLQYPPNTTMVSSYVESRGGKHPATIFFGLQAWLFKVLKNPVTLADVDESAWFCNQHGIPCNREGWEHIIREHNGFLPLEIEAAPEGELIPTGNVMLQVKNTDPACYWLTNFIETTLLRAIWYPTTVATNSFYAKKTILKYLDETSDAEAEATAQFMLHDFGARGVSSEESAALGGLAHLINFRGTDTMSALVAAKQYYREPMAGFSVPASEHSTMTSWTKSGEEAAYQNMLEQFAGSDIISIVADSYDIHNAVETIFGKNLKAKILENAKNGTRLTIRPDSGDPVETPIEIIKKLMAKFGSSTNSKGYKLLPDHIRVLQGDGITPDTIGIILERIKEEGLSAENIVFGMGAGLLQQCNRDTQKFAMKCSAVEVAGEMRDVFKDPVTDRGKASKRGILKLIKENDEYKTVRADSKESAVASRNEGQNHLRTVYRNGQMLITDSLETIRHRAFKAQ